MNKLILILLLTVGCSSTYVVNGRKGGVTSCLISKSGCIAEAVKECNGQIDFIEIKQTLDVFDAVYQCKGSGSGLKGAGY